LRDPGEGSLEDRIRILFGSEQIPDCVLNYNKRTLSSLSAYAENANRLIIVDTYDQDLRAYRVKVKTTYIYKNLMKDTGYDETLPLHVTPDDFTTNAPAEFGKVTSITIDGSQMITKQLPIERNGLTTELRLKMDKRGRSEVVFEYWTWMAVDAAQTMNPRRIVEVFDMKVVSQCDNVSPRLQIEGDQAGPKSLLYGQPISFSTVQGISPGEKIFEFRFLSPS
jgi:hypothetical protein